MKVSQSGTFLKVEDAPDSLPQPCRQFLTSIRIPHTSLYSIESTPTFLSLIKVSNLTTRSKCSSGLAPVASIRITIALSKSHQPFLMILGRKCNNLQIATVAKYIMYTCVYMWSISTRRAFSSSRCLKGRVMAMAFYHQEQKDALRLARYNTRTTIKIKALKGQMIL